MEEIELLNQKLKQIIPSEKYLQSEMVVSDFKNAISFYPAGKGVYKNVPKFPKGKIMVVGQDWGTKSAFDIDLNNDDEKNLKGATWRNIKTLFDEAGINMEWCFFTNAIMGLRSGDKILGKSPAFKKENKPFLELCRQFFVEQLNVCEPKIIIALGSFVPLFLHAFFEKDNFDFFSKVRSFKEIDVNNKSVLLNVQLANYSQKVNVIFLTHPSLYFVNVRYRKYHDLKEMPAEIEMIRDGLKSKINLS